MRFKKVSQMATKVSNHIFGLTVRIHQLHTLSLVLLIKFAAFSYSGGSSFCSGKKSERINFVYLYV
jgi:hypothetical protein